MSKITNDGLIDWLVVELWNHLVTVRICRSSVSVSSSGTTDQVRGTFGRRQWRSPDYGAAVSCRRPERGRRLHAAGQRYDNNQSDRFYFRQKTSIVNRYAYK